MENGLGDTPEWKLEGLLGSESRKEAVVAKNRVGVMIMGRGECTPIYPGNRPTGPTDSLDAEGWEGKVRERRIQDDS